MNRWHAYPPRHSAVVVGALVLLAGAAAQAQVAPASAWVTGTASQPKRVFPPSAQRGEMTVLNTHEVSMNGKTVRLSPGSRIRSPSNALLVSGSLVGQTFVVNHVRDTMGQVHEVWILNGAEAAERRPSTANTSTTNLTNSAD